MRTESEIVARCREIADEDFFGHQRSDLLNYVSFDSAREFLRPEADPAKWTHQPLTGEAVLTEMGEYVDFAWGKALGHRGLSAERSIDHYRAWIWLLGDDFPDADYPNYGVPILKAICERYSFPVPDDGAVLRMSQGRKCHPDCDEGCGEA